MESATSFEQILDISAAHVDAAIVSREAFGALLGRATVIAKPEAGAPRLLMACAALVRAKWVVGELSIELAGDDAETRLSIVADVGFRVAVFPPTKLRVPFDEFVRAVRLMPRWIAPLVATERDDVLILKADRRPSARPTAKMAAVELDVHTKPTVVRMQAVRPEDHARRDNDDDE